MFNLSSVIRSLRLRVKVLQQTYLIRSLVVHNGFNVSRCEVIHNVNKHVRYHGI